MWNYFQIVSKIVFNSCATNLNKYSFKTFSQTVSKLTIRISPESQYCLKRFRKFLLNSLCKQFCGGKSGSRNVMKQFRNGFKVFSLLWFKSSLKMVRQLFQNCFAIVYVRYIWNYVQMSPFYHLSNSIVNTKLGVQTIRRYIKSTCPVHRFDFNLISWHCPDKFELDILHGVR